VRVLVTGASGLIGRHAVDSLLECGHAVRTFQRSAPLSPDADHVRGDVRADSASLCSAARGCEALVHLAGRGDVAESRRDPVGYAELNATGALHALEAARAVGAAFILASTQRVYPLRPRPCQEDAALAPDSPYGYAKWVAELWCRMSSEQFLVPTTVLRFFSVYGPGQQATGGSGVVSIFASAALTGSPLQVQSAGRRDFVHAADAAQAIARAVEFPPRPSDARIFNIGTGVGTSFKQLATLIVGITGSSSSIEDQISEPAGRDLVADISQARAALGYQPSVVLHDGLERYMEWLRHDSA
jgi:UDP-glucose 4-epimerase